MSLWKTARNNWKALTLSAGVITASVSYLSLRYYQNTYPQFTSLPGPFEHIGVSQHRIPNGTRFKLYYPSSKSNVEKSNCKSPATYFTDIECISSLTKRLKIPSFLLNALNDLQTNAASIQCFKNAPIDINNKYNNKYPILLFSHGILGNFDIYSQICCGLASYGIIVAILEHTDESAIYTKLPNGKDLFHEPGYLIDDKTGQKYRPKPWKTKHDIQDFGDRRLKPIRIPQFLKCYDYLTNSNDRNDVKLNEILNYADMNNIICGGQSFGGVTSWFASKDINDINMKGLLLLDPWFGCLNVNELKQTKLNIPMFILSSENWLKTKKYVMKLTQIVVDNNNIDSNKNIWEFATKFVHYDTSDVPCWGPSFLTNSREIYTVQQWNDLLCKRCASFIADIIPSFKQQYIDNDNISALQYDTNYVQPVNLQKSNL